MKKFKEISGYVFLIFLIFLAGPGLIIGIVYSGDSMFKERTEFSQNYSAEIINSYHKGEKILCGEYEVHRSRYGTTYYLLNHFIFSKKTQDNELKFEVPLDGLTASFIIDKNINNKEFFILNCEIYDKNRILYERRIPAYSLIMKERGLF